MNELTQLKAKAYDILAAIEDLSKQLQAVNAEITKHYQPAEQEEERTIGLDAMDIVNALGPNGMAELEARTKEK